MGIDTEAAGIFCQESQGVFAVLEQMMEAQFFTFAEDSIVDGGDRNSRLRQFLENQCTLSVKRVFRAPGVPSAMNVDEKRGLFVHFRFGVDKVEPILLLFRVFSVLNIQFTFEAELT